LSILFAVLMACTPVPPSALRSPQAYITPQPSLVPTLTVTATATPPATSPAEIARQVYGARLIERIRIPALEIDSAVVPMGWQQDAAGNIVWDSPEAAVGWMISSALPDAAGNIVLYGHNNLFTQVFRDLWRSQPGDVIFLETGQGEWEYHVWQVKILPMLPDPTNGAAYLQNTSAPRLTLLSCWPPQSNTHRVVVLAAP
jgi:LPXTG-site transpeptidase (sortase) family protein